MDINYTTEEILNTINDKEIEVLIIASIETLKHQKSKCSKDEVFKLVKDTTEENITRDIFDKALESLIESGSVKCSFISNKTFLSLRKHNAIENSNLQGNFNNFKEDLIEDFDKLKNTFFAEVESFKDKLLDSIENVVGSPTDVSKTFMAHILEEVYFLQKQLKSKDEMINSLLNQLAKCNDMLELQKSNHSSSSSENKKDQNRNNEVKSVVIIGNSMIKHLNGWDMSKKVRKSECRVYVKSFPGAKTSCMRDYMKTSLRSTPNHFILNVGMNDLNSNQTSEVIAKEIVDLTTSLKNNQHKVSVSNIILRTDNSKLNVKRCDVNRILSQLCHERNINLIDHLKKIKPNHLNKGKLHLNKNGSDILSQTFVNEISRVFN